MYIPILWISIIIILVFALALFIFLSKKKRLAHIKRSLDMSLFLIKLPRYESHEKDKQEEKKVISKMEQIYSNFLNLKKGERVVLEISSEVGHGDISFYIAVPSSYENALSKYVQGVYSGAVLEKIPGDYTVFEPEGEVSASFLKLKKNFFFPVNTYENLEKDPIESIANAVSSISPDEGSSVQVVIQACPFSLREKGEKLLFKITEQKKSFKEAMAELNIGTIGKTFKEFSKEISKKEKDDSKEIKERKVGDDTIEAIKEKIKKPAFEVNIRLIGVAKNKEDAEKVLHSLESGFSQFSSSWNEFKTIRAKKKQLKQLIYDYSFRNFRKEQANILNNTELVSVYHLPLSHMESPYIKWARTKEAPPPSDLPQSGPLFIGNAVYREGKKKVYMASNEDRMRHFYIIGQTGTGKSNFLRQMIRQDLESGEGVGVVDPHGDLIEHTLLNIPKERIDDVILFEPFDRERPCGLNMLEWDLPEQKSFAINEMITIFGTLFDPTIIGPMFEYYMRNAMAALMADKENPGTLVEIPKMFVDEEFREKRARRVTDPMIRDFWLKEWKQTTGQTASDMRGYVVSKIGRFVQDEMMRGIIGQSKSSFDLSKAMNEGKIFLADLSKGKTGELNSKLLGLVLVSKMQVAAMQRARMPEEERKDFFLYVDEFQNFTTESVATILSEARKYRLSLNISHQFMPQLTEEIRNAVVGNVGTMASFRVGAGDAEFLENQFTPEFSRFDLMNIDNFQYITKTMINGKVTSPFKVHAPPPTPGDKETAKKAREISKLKYGKPRIMVEKEILER